MIRIAAHDATDKEKAAADFICDGEHDSETFQRAMRVSRTIQLSTGHFSMDVPLRDVSITGSGIGKTFLLNLNHSGNDYV